jgi:hypothetical protein
MKKVFNWFWLILYFAIPVYFTIVLFVSAFGYCELNEMIDYQWWLFFFAFEIWFTSVAAKRIDEGYERIKGE